MQTQYMFPNTEERYGGWELFNGTKTNSHEIRVQSESNMTNQEKWQLIQFDFLSLWSQFEYPKRLLHYK